MDKIEKKPSFWVSLLPILTLATFLAVVIILKGADALDGGSQFALILSTAVATALSMGIYGVKWETLENAIATNIFSSSNSILIFLFIGAIAGTWMVSGVVPRLSAMDCRFCILQYFLSLHVLYVLWSAL